MNDFREKTLDKNKMHICFVADGDHPNTRNWIYHFANVFGHKVSLISFNSSKKPVISVDTYFLPEWLKNVKFRYIVGIPAIKRLVKKISPDILIGYRVVSYAVSAAACNFHPLVIAAQAAYVVHPGIHPDYYRIFAKYAIKRADLIHSWAEHTTRDLLSLGADSAKIVTFPRGVDVNFFKMNDIPNTDKKPFVAITTRHLNRAYNFDQIIEATAIVSKKIPDFRVLIAGDGEDKARLQNLVRELGIERNVEFLGSVTRDKLSQLLRNAHLYLSSVISDGVSSSLLEAMASGTFPIVTDNEANRIWIDDGKNGFLVRYKDSDDLAKKILEAYKDDDLRVRSIYENRKIVEKEANWDKNMKRMESLYLKLLGRNIDE